jgi:hypothetical protein
VPHNKPEHAGLVICHVFFTNNEWLSLLLLLFSILEKKHYPLSRSYRKEIFNSIMSLQTDFPLELIDFKWLARKVGIPMYKVQAEFKDLDDFYYHLAIEYWKNHENKSKKIAQLKGVYALETLIKHDLNSVYSYLKVAPLIKQQHPVRSAATVGEEYFNNRMEVHYFDVLRMNTELLPKEGVDIRIYANFIVHSLFFIGMDPSSIHTIDETTLKTQTRTIINSLLNSTSNANIIG